eukprot:141049_1
MQQGQGVGRQMKMMRQNSFLILATMFALQMMTGCEAAGEHATPHCCNSYTDFSALEGVSIDFIKNVTALHTNFHTSPTIATHPYEYLRGVFSNNPSPPTLQLSPGVGTCGKPRQVPGLGECVPLCCTCCGDIKVLAADLPEEYVNGTSETDPNRSVPELNLIPATDLSLCCGPEVEASGMFQTTSTSSIGTNTRSFYEFGEFHSTNHCQLVSGDQSEPIRPFQLQNWEIIDDSSHTGTYSPPLNYPVRVFCAAKPGC